ncbi:MAG TPA: rhodanese-like domain-containing protein [Solirubrobacteraceae bacterium]|jgi:rhodanese-related sulfurtransferase
MRIGTNVMLFTRKITMLSPSETWEAHQRNDLVLVDVRQRPEWRSGVVSGVLLIPLNELPRRIGELPREKTVAFLCRSGHRSTLAARQARRHGFDVVSVKGGMIAWQSAGLPTSTPPRHDSPPT